MSRGDRRDKIYLGDIDRQDFLKTLAEMCQKTGFEIHAYCLMPNHFHFVVETPEANLVSGMAWLLSEEMRRLGWTEADLLSHRKNAAGKLEMAARLRRETTLTVKWIGRRVHLGTSKGANRNLHQWMKNNPAAVNSCPAQDEPKASHA